MRGDYCSAGTQEGLIKWSLVLHRSETTFSTMASSKALPSQEGPKLKIMIAGKLPLAQERAKIQGGCHPSDSPGGKCDNACPLSDPQSWKHIGSMSPEEIWKSLVMAPSPESQDYIDQWGFLIWFSLTRSCPEAKPGLFIPTSGSFCSDSLFKTFFSIYWLSVSFAFPYASIHHSSRKKVLTLLCLASLHQLGQTISLSPLLRKSY